MSKHKTHKQKREQIERLKELKREWENKNYKNDIWFTADIA